MVVFGDSITTTHFQVKGELPSITNPLGNPDLPGKTTANGPNWLSYLTTTYNATFVKTINLAYGGATVDSDIIARPLDSGIKSFKDQVMDQWLASFVPPPVQFDWKPENTLFVTFLGNNDVCDTYLASNTSAPDISALEMAVEQYAALLDILYQNGGRNFLVPNVLPFERSPMVGKNSEKIRKMGYLTRACNSNLARVVSNFRDTYSDAKVFMFDTHDLFTQLLNNPCSHEETCPLQVTTTYCESYKTVRDDQYKFDAACEYSVDKYFWLSAVHPSFRVHNAMAKVIAAYLQDET